MWRVFSALYAGITTTTFDFAIRAPVYHSRRSSPGLSVPKVFIVMGRLRVHEAAARNPAHVVGRDLAEPAPGFQRPGNPYNRGTCHRLAPRLVESLEASAHAPAPNSKALGGGGDP